MIGPIALAVIWREREQSTMPAEEEPVFCPAKECQARLPQHHPLCSVSPIEHKVESLKFYFHQYQKAWRQNDVLRQELKERVTFWQGKCAVLRHENNKLRKKLRDAGLLT